jgi:heat shock protein HslJ
MTPSLHDYITASLHHCITASFRHILTASLIVSAAGCASTGGNGATPPAGNTLYTARGNEPGWSLTVGTDRLAFTTGYGKRTVVVPLPGKQELAGGVSYRYDARTEAHRLRVHVRRQVCRDTMTGVPYPDIVAVILDRERPLAGCGGAAESLLHGAWTVESVDGAEVAEKARATLDFRPDGRLGGRAFCNSYTTDYAVTGEGLRINDAIAATRMACPPALMRQEATFLEILGSVTAHDIRPDGALVITGAGDRTIVARREKTEGGR